MAMLQRNGGRAGASGNRRKAKLSGDAVPFAVDGLEQWATGGRVRCKLALGVLKTPERKSIHGVLANQGHPGVKQLHGASP